jgi:hypothetical protein
MFPQVNQVAPPGSGSATYFKPRYLKSTSKEDQHGQHDLGRRDHRRHLDGST